MLLAGTVGLRWGEAIGLRVADVDFLRRRLSVRQTVEEVSGHVRVVEATKSEAGRRTFALPAFLVDELAAHLAAYRPGATPDDLVFLGPKGGILRRSFEARMFRPARRAVPISGVRVGVRLELSQHALDCRHKPRQVLDNGDLDLGESGVEVPVREAISHPDDVPPRDPRLRRQNGRVDVLDCLTDLDQANPYRIEHETVPEITTFQMSADRLR